MNALPRLALALVSLAPLAASQDLDFRASAPGVWSATLGTPGLSLLEVAGAEPRTDALARMPETEFPYAADAIEARATARRARLRFPLAEGEEVYGLGLDFDSVRQNGRIHELRVDHWGGRTGRTHAPVAFFVTSLGRGVLVDSARYLKVYVGTGLRNASDRPPTIYDRTTERGWQAHPPGDSIEVHVPEGGARVHIFGGPSTLDAVRRHVLFTGGGPLPPRWGLGFTHRTPTPYSADDLLAEVDAFDEHGFPLDFVGVEPGWHSSAYPCTFEWSPERFPDPRAFLGELEQRGLRANLWMNPYVHPEGVLAEALGAYAASHRVWNGLVIDYAVPAAQRAFRAHLERETLRLGVSGFKVDEVDGFDRWLWPEVTEFPSGLDAEEQRQSYGLRLLRLFDEAYRARDQRTWGLARATNAGGTRFPFVIYNDHYSHQDFITALVNSSFSGLLWTPEVRSSDNGEEWLRRMQTTCVSPMAMLNAWASGTQPWSFPEVYEEVRAAAQLRMRLLPYLYSAFARYHFDGMPPVRAMPLVEGWDSIGEAGERRKRLKDQFVVGDALLVAPFFAGQKERNVLLPPGRWYDFHTGAYAGDGELILAEAQGWDMPLYVREGQLIPFGEERLRAPLAQEERGLQLRWYGEADAHCRVYDDDGASFAYERGEYRWLDFSVSQGELIAPESGPYSSVELLRVRP